MTYPNPLAIVMLFLIFFCHLMTILLLRLNENVRKEISLLPKRLGIIVCLWLIAEP